MDKQDRQRIMELIEKVVESYERMLQKVVIEQDKEFNSVPYEKAVTALNRILDMEEEQND